METVVTIIFIYSIAALSFGVYCLVKSNKKIKATSSDQEDNEHQ